MNRRPFQYLLAGTTVLIILFTIYRLAVALPRGSELDHVSGVWATLALDASDGVFYRPLFEEGGYGGTRVFPLYFALHAGLIKAFGHPVLTGYILSILSMAALIAGVFCLLKAEGVETRLAACAAVATLATVPAQLALTTIRGDALPAALNVWGLALVVKSLRKECRVEKVLVPAGVLFALALLAKPTAVYGLGASCLALTLRGLQRPAVFLAVTYITVAAAGLGLTEHVSGGRFIASTLACASGGATPDSVLSAPLSLINIASYKSPFGPLILVLAGWGLIAALIGRSGHELLPLALVLTFGVTLLIFGSTGINYNHLLDLYVIGFVIFVVQIGRGRINFRAGAVALALLCSLLLYDSFNSYRVSDRQDNITLYSEIAREVGERGGPVLSENPWFPIFAGMRPYLLDPFMFRLLSQKDPRMWGDMRQKLEGRYFRTIILSKPPDAPGDIYWYREIHFGPGFIGKLNSNYQAVKDEGGVRLYHPR